MFKILMSAAAIAIIAFVAYFFYGEWKQRHDAEQLAQLQQEQARSAATSNCLQTVEDLTAVLAGRSLPKRFVQYEARAQLRTCVAEGYLSTSDVAEFDL